MQKRISNIPFKRDGKEQEAQLFEIIEKHKNEPGAIMPCSAGSPKRLRLSAH